MSIGWAWIRIRIRDLLCVRVCVREKERERKMMNGIHLISWVVWNPKKGRDWDNSSSMPIFVGVLLLKVEVTMQPGNISGKCPHNLTKGKLLLPGPISVDAFFVWTIQLGTSRRVKIVAANIHYSPRIFLWELLSPMPPNTCWWHRVLYGNFCFTSMCNESHVS